MKYIISVDVGTTAMKAALIDTNGKIAVHKTYEYSLITPHAGWAEMDVRVYEETLKGALNELLRCAYVDPDDVLTLTFSVQGETTVLLDQAGKPLRNAIVWFDSRAAAEAQEIVNTFGAENIQRRTGQVGEDAIWPGAKLLWLRKHEPKLFGKICTIIQLNGYLGYILTGKAAEDDSILGSSIYWDINTRKYWLEMLEFLQINESQLPEVVYPGTDLGPVTPQAAKRFGLSGNTRVNIGAIDLACGAIGVGNVRKGIFSDSMGSALCSIAMTDEPMLDPKMKMPCYCSALPDKYMIHAYATGGMFMRWFRDSFCETEMNLAEVIGVNAYDQLDLMATNIAPGCDGLIALPHLQGSGPPDQHAGANAMFYGMTVAHKKAHFVRAIMESVTMVLCRMLEATKELGVNPDRVICFGGGAKSKVWTQMKADALGLPIYTVENDEHATCVGTMILAGIALGLWENAGAGAERIVKPGKVYTPNKELYPVYAKLLSKYKLLMDCMRPIFDLAGKENEM